MGIYQVLTNIGASLFRSNGGMPLLNISVNNISSIDPDTFSYNKQLRSLDLQNNSISDIHVTTFRYNSRLRRLDISGNSIAHFNRTDLFDGMDLNIPGHVAKLSKISWQLCIQDARAFRNTPPVAERVANSRITALHWPHEFAHLYLSGNNESEISTSSFRGVEHLDLSNKYNEKLNTLVFESVQTDRIINFAS